MSARFRVHRTRVLRERSLFVLSGIIEEGMVNTGMRAVLEDAEAPFEATVHTVEFAPGGEDADGPPEPALTFHYSSEEKLERWTALPWEGSTVLLAWYPREGGSS